MNKVTDIVNKIEDEAGDIELKAKQLNAQLDDEADKALDAAKRSPFTGIWMLFAILAVVLGAFWFIAH